ncbi:hypothetical protein ASF28_09135 [Methylobacterium sp. Leaf99]|uniref:hypothetical protein n=1 Tax=Methylobacterium sp. Leaf99 TaxID=1736251 RepID=UPI000701B9A9|nr:hypothetical protein [Methylobacterium sp. Leaf99]KQP11198.1 hypothetical protein ASF28_09135 [Methylobacterium sp. Leaf99]
MASAFADIEAGSEGTFAFIAIDEHTFKGCVIHKATDLGAHLIMLNTSGVPSEFILYPMGLDRAQLCKVIWRTDEAIGAWFEANADEGYNMPLAPVDSCAKPTTLLQ